MSDYLSRAADRASATGSTVRPVLPSLFDSDKSADNVMTTLKFPEAQQHLEAKDRDSTKGKVVRAASEVQERVASVLALAPETPATTEAEKRESNPGQKFGDVAPTKVRGGSTEFESRSDKSSVPERSDLRPRVARSNPVAEPSVELKESASHSRESRSHAEVKPSDELPSKPAPRRPAASFRPMQARNPVRSADRESSSERTIQVTIGRLEVRAVQSAPAPPKPNPPRPRISLEEYLRSRNRGAG